MSQILIHEVGLRDGLQVEKQVVPTGIKLEWLGRLMDADLDIIQVGSFMHPEKVPQMADTDELFRCLSTRKRNSDLVLSVWCSTRKVWNGA